MIQYVSIRTYEGGYPVGIENPVIATGFVFTS